MLHRYHYVRFAAAAVVVCPLLVFAWTRQRGDPPTDIKEPPAPTKPASDWAAYQHTVRDLLGVDFKPADDFPPDDSGHGFDNIGGALSVTPTLMEKYLAAAEKVARTAVFGAPPMPPEKTAHQPYFTADAFSK